jgi:hopanoid biosynthesis associated RND transporter like protein HpnN
VSSTISQTSRGGFIARLGHRYIQALGALVVFSLRRAPAVIGVALALTAAAVYYTMGHFSINTDTSQALSRDLPFQQIQNKVDGLFPQLHDTVLLVIDGDNASLADEGARRLAAWLKTRPQYIDSVYQSGGDEFFRKNGLLYLSTDELWTLSNRLSEAQPLISQVAQRPTLPELLSVLEKGLDRTSGADAQLGGMDTVFAQLGKTLNAQADGRFYQLPWDELITGSSGGEEQRRRFIIVKPHLDYEEMQPAQGALDVIAEGAQRLGLDGSHGVRVRITGSAALDNEQLSTVSRGAGTATALSVTLVLVLLVIGLRSPRLVFFNLATLFMGLSWTAAFALSVTGPLNLISIAFAVLFIGLGVDFGIQFCMRYLEEYNAGDAHAAVLRRAATGVGGALSLAAVAAAASFYSFVPTSYAGIVDLGIISGTSMFIALLANLTVLPALLTYRPAAVPGVAHGVAIRLPSPNRTGARAITAAALILAVAAVPLIERTHFDFNPMHMQNPNAEAVKTFQYLLRHSKIPPYPIDILEPSLARADAVAQRLDGLKEVSQAITLSSYVPDGQDEKLDIIQQMGLLLPPFTLGASAAPPPDPAAIRTALAHFHGALTAFAAAHPRDPLANAAHDLALDVTRYLARFAAAPGQLGVLQSRVMDGLATQLQDLQLALEAEPVSLASLPADLRARYLTAGGAARVEVMSALDLNDNANMRRFVDAVRRVAPDAVGPPVMLVEGGDAVVGAFGEATAISVVCITVLLLAALRNVVDALIVLAPLGIAAVWTVAAMELLGISFNLANIIVLPLLIGLGVAYGIYLVVRWRGGVPVGELMHSSTSRAVLFSALTTMSSFGSLAVAGDPGMSILGKTLSLSLTAVLLSMLVLLPALLRLRAPSRQPAETVITAP